MACLKTVVFLALLCAVANAIEQINRPPINDGENDQHISHRPFPDEVSKINDPTQEQEHDINDPNILEIAEERKFFKPYFHPYHPVLHNPHITPETPASEEVVDSAEPETKYQERVDSDNEVGQEEHESETVMDEAMPYEDESRMSRKSYEVPCDFLSLPKYSCYTCYTYLVCKPDGGKVKSCSEANAPYCNNGECSASPSAECQQNSSAVFY